MKRNYYILSACFLLTALLSGILTSGISLVGRVGVNTFYRNYRFFKIWWQAALVCFLLLALVALLLYSIDKKFNGSKRLIFLTGFLFVFLGGLYISYADFRNSLSHRWLGERFHLGIYLYWLGSCITDLFFLLTPRTVPGAITSKSGAPAGTSAVSTDPDATAPRTSI
ncbi:cytochrome d ubiquinol oxidase subunit II [Niabella pedocola]|uniref:Cytochrome d ubiquinol oxidase subunit II n=1 Tax=Niabella pedocola TaxID=1752077 RepID=A0ABS8PPZ3_9BACT|nr:cytochrome d ubiquinol oxidase subunit II [Niabella pedocola]MCD2423153.1 cytochrome d ubiquinol oxidase subunit II [Niabella pedocola]